MLGWLCRAGDRLRQRALARSAPPDHAAGRRGEDIAHRYLQELGYTVVARNFSTRSGSGELDLVARDGPGLVFVEVKTRRGDEVGSPASAVDQEKRRRILRAAREYARRAGADPAAARYDIVSVVLEEPPRIEHLRGVFGAPQAI
jgi:putative endonuclease